ncbi:hypothetical protein [Paraburkholderia pallida]|nr:hypothetical protein [Paraburkholderia pallida]
MTDHTIAAWSPAGVSSRDGAGLRRRGSEAVAGLMQSCVER